MVFIALPLAATVLVGLWIAAIARGRRRFRVAEPQCAACGYCVRGISCLICPECGADLREAGILTPGMQRPPQRLGILGRVLAWSALLLVVALLACAVVLPILPQQFEQTLTAFISCQMQNKTLTLHAGTMGSRLVGTRVYASTTRIPMETVTLTFHESAVPETPLEIDLVEQRCQFVGSQGAMVRRDRFERETVLEWLACAGLDTNASDVQEAAGYVVTAVTTLARSPSQTRYDWGKGPQGRPMVQLTISGSGTVLRHAWWTVASLAALWLLAWLVGTRFIVRQERGAWEARPAAQGQNSIV